MSIGLNWIDLSDISFGINFRAGPAECIETGEISNMAIVTIGLILFNINICIDL